MILAVALARFAGLVALAYVGGALIIGGRAGVSIRRGSLIACAVIAPAAVLLQAVLQATLAGGDDGFTFEVFRTLLTSTWSGNITLLRLALAIVLAALIFSARTTSYRPVFVLAVLGLLVAPLSGHAATADPAPVSYVFHCLHVLAGALWLGGLLSVTELAFTTARQDSFRRALAAFSPLALLLVFVAMIAGTGAAVLQIERPAALIGTLYGQLLVVKVFVLLVPALIAAAWLRWRYLRGRGNTREAVQAIAIETAFGLGVMAIGTLIAQSIGRHDEIDWPLAFRFAPQVNWRIDGLAQDMLAAITGAVVALGFAAYLFWKRREFRSAAALCAIAGCVCLVFLGYLISVPAYPTTFAVTPVAYTAQSIMRGRVVYIANCVVCHGMTGHGDGPGAGVLPIAPADLAARHTADHTAGDMFWWIENGTSSGAMPGVGDQIDDEDKWNLISYIRALSSGYLGRYVPKRVIPKLAWLGAIDFSYQTADDGNAQLNDLREQSVVLLVLIRDAKEADRVRALIAAAADLGKAKTRIIVVSPPHLLGELGPLPGNVTFVDTDSTDILDAWSLYRRTFWDMDPQDENPAPAYMEFLIDRFGYVRLRGRGDDDTLSAIETLVRQAAYLADEPQLHPPPDDHVH